MDKSEIQKVEQKKKSLKRYKRNLACISRLEAQLEQTQMRMTAIKSPSLSGMPRGGTPVTIADLVADKMELEERISRLKEKSKKMRSEILKEIDGLDDPRYCEILELFFIKCLTMEEIADRTGYNLRHVYRLYSEGVTYLALEGQ